jgi:hypothetical protein
MPREIMKPDSLTARKMNDPLLNKEVKNDGFARIRISGDPNSEQFHAMMELYEGIGFEVDPEKSATSHGTHMRAPIEVAQAHNKAAQELAISRRKNVNSKKSVGGDGHMLESDTEIRSHSISFDDLPKESNG